MKYSVEVMRVREQTIQLNGWAVENDPDSVITYRIEDEAGNPVDAKIVPTRRDDVSQISVSYTHLTLPTMVRV